MSAMNDSYLDQITLGDCREHLSLLEDGSIDLFLSDIPYGIGLDDWDVLHNNTNSALLGQSPAQQGKSAFKRRGKPINGWSQADRNIGKEYEEWCKSWAEMVRPQDEEWGIDLRIWCTPHPSSRHQCLRRQRVLTQRHVGLG